ncbi:STAS-like domain-containing protein [Nitrobacter sp. JJSN]|uniref:STAS-like domain-containing protein n=1 Tax=Nitrobacter sp. JJSN TaxID=3453033 RepID=UPI003F75A87E
MVIHVRDLVSGANTADQGVAVFPYLELGFSKEARVVVSFDGITTATSSFVNSAIVPLLKTTTFAEIKRRLRVIDSTRQINEMIRARLERESFVEA